MVLCTNLEEGRFGQVREVACLSPTVVGVMDPTLDNEWESCVQSHAESAVFHSARWIRTLAETYGFKPASVSCRVGNQSAALIPILEVKTVLGTAKGVCLPFTDFCGPLLWAKAQREPIWERLVCFARSRSWRSIELRGGDPLLDGCQPFLSFYGHTLDIGLGERRLFARLDPAVRRALRKAARSGLDAEVSNDWAAVATYYALHCQTRRRHGLPPQSVRFFKSIHRNFIAPGHGFVVVANMGQAPVAAALFLRLGEKALFKFGASDTAFQSLRPNNLVLWEAIRFLSRNGCASLHLGRTSRANLGLRRFKRGWGAAEHEIRYWRYDLKRCKFVAGRDRAFGWHNRVFRALPLWLGRAAGAMLYRFSV